MPEIKDKIEQNRARLKQEQIYFLQRAARIKKVRFGKIISFLPFLLIVPGLFLGYFLLFLFKRNDRLVKARWLKLFLRCFFYCQGLSLEGQEKLPRLEKSGLILAPFYSAYSALFIYAWMPGLLIVPLKKFFCKLKFFGKLMETISYEEGPLAQNIANINKLLANGYAVLVHTNAKSVETEVGKKPEIYPELEEITGKSCEIYYLKLKGLENMAYSSLFSRQKIKVELVSKENFLSF
jgi:hypothetical protein